MTSPEGAGTSATYRTCSIKTRRRRTKRDLDQILLACKDIVAEEERVTLRHLFYRLVSLGLIEKTEAEYRKLSGYTMRWRRNGDLDWGAFVDSTRWYHGAVTFDSLNASLEYSKACYRRNLWQSQAAYVEIWTEKNAIAAIAQEAAEPFGVPVFPMVGFGSGSALYSIARTIKKQQELGKSVYIYHLGDWDPSGKCIDESTVKNLYKDHGATFSFSRLAVTPEQIKHFSLPTRPTKKTDPRSKSFQGESVEVDAMPPHIIRDLVEHAITCHIEPRAWGREKETENMEKETLDRVVAAVEAVLSEGGF